MSSKLEHENRSLKQQLYAFKKEASNNEALLKKFQERELALLASDSLAELLVSLTEGLRLSFNLDQIKLTLYDPESEIQKLLQHSNTPAECFTDVNFVNSLQDISCNLRNEDTPWLGPCMSGKHGKLFDVSESRSVAILPLTLRNELTGCIAMGSNDSKRFTRSHATDFLQRLAAIGSVCLENAINRELIILSGLTDALTGFYNRAYLERRLNEEISRASRYQQPLSCLFLDIDFFKKVNDTHGHASGDYVLKEVARRILSQLRGSDIPVRFGGEEFTLLLPQTCSEEALLLAERIRQAIHSTPVTTDDGLQLTITISIGISQTLAHEHEKLAGLGAALLHDADTALYQAKEAGRNRAVLSTH
ncbi:MAG: sensor domain-containing diguanylate cyclase [Gammaproteobacteria bacterium]|nr:sensor domain-containing diguanylate cyclase [Gammaproteobacteria bacterium]